MKKLHVLLLIAMLALLTGCRQQSADDVPVAAADAPASVPTDALTATSDEPADASAVIQDDADIFRLCTTRPQRVLPSHASKNQRTTGKQPNALRSILHHSPNKAIPAAAGASRAPLPFVVSRNYYVIALRRILR